MAREVGRLTRDFTGFAGKKGYKASWLCPYTVCAGCRKSFYTPDPVKGYTDYPCLDQIKPGAPTRTHYSGVKIFA